MTTGQQDRDFTESVIPSSLLEQAIEWIASNLTFEDVERFDNLYEAEERIRELLEENNE